jgi:hypothetical protein
MDLLRALGEPLDQCPLVQPLDLGRTGACVHRAPADTKALGERGPLTAKYRSSAAIRWAYSQSLSRAVQRPSGPWAAFWTSTWVWRLGLPERLMRSSKATATSPPTAAQRVPARIRPTFSSDKNPAGEVTPP